MSNVRDRALAKRKVQVISFKYANEQLLSLNAEEGWPAANVLSLSPAPSPLFVSRFRSPIDFLVCI